MDTPFTEITAFTIDCSDAARLARFYADLLGGEVTFVDEEHGYGQTVAGAHTLNFQQVDAYTAPSWPSPDRPQQYHLDLRARDLDEGVAFAEGLGASSAAEQPAPEHYRVVLDPDGHPFCVCPPTGG